MRLALDEARKSGPDIPVGALIVSRDGELIVSSHNLKEVLHDATAHAEINVIREASKKLSRWRLEGFTLVTTLEPCAMCAAAIANARVSRLVFGAWDERAGAAGSYLDLVRDNRIGPPVEVLGGVLEQDCSQLIKEFFENKR